MKIVLLLISLSLATGCLNTLKKLQDSFRAKSGDSHVNFNHSELLTRVNPLGPEREPLFEPDFVFRFPEGKAYGFMLLIENKGNPLFEFKLSSNSNSEMIKDGGSIFNDLDYDMRDPENRPGRKFAFEYFSAVNSDFTDPVRSAIKNNKVHWWSHILSEEDFVIKEPVLGHDGQPYEENGKKVYNYTNVTGHRVFVIIPESRLPMYPNQISMELYNQVYNQETKQADVWAPAKINLTRNAVKDILVIGDSVMWGQGLKEENKFHAKLSKDILMSTGTSSRIYRYAHSGAIAQVDDSKCSKNMPTYDGVHGEVPKEDHPHKRIGCQIEEFKKTPGIPDIDLVLMTGGANDAGLLNVFGTSIFTPTFIFDSFLKNKIEGPVKSLVSKVKGESLFANSKIVYTSYYSPISSNSWLNTWPAPTPIGFLSSKAAQWNVSVDSLIENTVFGSLPRDRVAVAKVSFGAHEGIGAQNSHVWDFFKPVDEVAKIRQDGCKLAGMGGNDDCNFAAKIHPNANGATKYSHSVITSAKSIFAYPAPKAGINNSGATPVIKCHMETSAGKCLMQKVDSVDYP